VAQSIEALFTAAAWADKYDGAIHNTPIRNVTLAVPEAIGVMGILLPDDKPLLALCQLAGEAMEHLKDLEVLVLNALWWRPHPTHLSIPEAIATAQALGARRTYLTHLSHETGHAELTTRLPAGIEPAYDGLTLEIDA
jgi:hypothetical protein